MKETTEHPSVCNLIGFVLSCIPETSSGTYNRADPTAWSKGSITLTFQEEPYTLHYNDCTWGNTLIIIKGRIELGRFYFGWDRRHRDGKWMTQESVTPRQDTKGLLKLLFQLKPLLEPVPEPEYFDDPMGCPSDYI